MREEKNLQKGLSGRLQSIVDGRLESEIVRVEPPPNLRPREDGACGSYLPNWETLRLKTIRWHLRHFLDSPAITATAHRRYLFVCSSVSGLLDELRVMDLAISAHNHPNAQAILVLALPASPSIKALSSLTCSVWLRLQVFHTSVARTGW